MTHEQAVAKQAPERYLLDEMPELERFAFEEHLFTCAVCAADVRAGGLMQDAVKAGLLPAAAPGTGQPTGDPAAADGARVTVDAPGPTSSASQPAVAEAPPARPAPGPDGGRQPASPPRSLRRFMPWAVAAMLAVAAGYQALWVVPGLRRQVIGPSVLSPVTLRGATRGAEPALSRPASGVISLAVELAGVPPGSRLTYDLRATGQAPVASGTAAAPPPGTPLLLLIPASALHAAGRYVLSVDAGGAGSAPVEYRFTITDP